MHAERVCITCEGTVDPDVAMPTVSADAYKYDLEFRSYLAAAVVRMFRPMSFLSSRVKLSNLPWDAGEIRPGRREE